MEEQRDGNKPTVIFTFNMKNPLWRKEFRELQKDFPIYYSKAQFITNYLYEFVDWVFAQLERLPENEWDYLKITFRKSFLDYLLLKRRGDLKKTAKDILGGEEDRSIFEKDGYIYIKKGDSFHRYRLVNNKGREKEQKI